MSKSNISEALAIGWFLVASQFRGSSFYYGPLTLGFMCLAAALIIAFKEDE